jgi:hypothetical protein
MSTGRNPTHGPGGQTPMEKENFLSHFKIKVNHEIRELIKGPARSRTGITGIRIPGANHYTTEPLNVNLLSELKKKN